MFAARYFNVRYWAARYWPKVGATAIVVGPTPDARCFVVAAETPRDFTVAADNRIFDVGAEDRTFIAR